MRHPVYQTRRERRSSLLGRLLLWCVVLLLVLLALAIIGAPWAVQYGVPYALSRHGIAASMDAARVDLARREIALQGFRLGDASEPALSFEEVGLGLDVAALAGGQLRLRHVRVEGVDVDPRRLATLPWRGTRALPGAGARPRDGLPVAVEDLDLENVRLAFLSHAVGHEVLIERLRARGIGRLAPGATADLLLQARVGDAPLTLVTELSLEQDGLGLAGDYRLEGVPLDGWSALGGVEAPWRLHGGALHGVGELRAQYAVDSRSGGLALEGTLRAVGVEAAAAPAEIRRTDATWRGRLTGKWTPGEKAPTLRGEGILEVGRLELHRGGDHPQGLAISDTTWNGEFDWHEGLTFDGGILGGAMEVSGGTGAGEGVSWRARAEDYSWRVHAVATTGPQTFTLRLQDVELGRLSALSDNAATPVEIAVEGVAVDEVRAAHTGDFVVGRLAARSVVARDPRADAPAHDLVWVVDDLVAEGMTGGMPGKVQVARMSAASVSREGDAVGVRAEELRIVTFGVSLSGRLGAEELAAQTVRYAAGGVDTWLSELRASRLSGEAGAEIDVGAVTVASVFSSGDGAASWEASHLVLNSLADVGGDSPRAAALALDEFAYTGDEALWEAAGLLADEVSVTGRRALRAERARLDRLEGSAVTVGTVTMTGLSAEAVQVAEAARLDALAAQRIEFVALAGDRWAVSSARADAVAIGSQGEGRATRLAAKRIEGETTDGARHAAEGIELDEASASAAGDIRVDAARVESATRRDAAGDETALSALEVSTLRREPQGAVSAASAAAASARVSGPGAQEWRLEGLDGRALSWAPGGGAGLDRLALASLRREGRGLGSLAAEGVTAAGVERLPGGDLTARTLGAVSARSLGDAPAWRVGGVDLRGLHSTGGGALALDDAALGELTIEEETSGARLSLSRGQAEGLRVEAGTALSVRHAAVHGLRLGSDSPGSPAAFAAAELSVVEARVRFGELVEVGETSARDVDLVLGQGADDAWLLPALPLAAQSGANAVRGTGLRVGSLAIEGTSRIELVDLATEPAFRAVLEPVVHVMRDLDTAIAGRAAEFRLEGRHGGFGRVRAEGRLVARLHGFDLRLEADLAGIDVTAFAPYLRRSERVVPRDGRADADVDVVLEDDVLEGNAGVLLSGLRLMPAGDAAPLARPDERRIPLSMLVGLLKDAHGNVRLEVPLSARVGPGFDLVEHAGEALRAAAEAAAGLPGSAFAGNVQAVDTAAALLPAPGSRDYRPVRFAAGEAHLRAEPLVYLDGVARRLRADDALSFSLCGKATGADGALAQAEPSPLDRRFAEASAGTFQVAAGEAASGTALAALRAETVRRYLHEAHGIDRERLAPCRPQTETGPAALPRVELVVGGGAAAGVLEGVAP